MKIVFLLIYLLIFSCSKKEQEPTPELDYLKAYKLLQDKNYAESAKAFEKIEDDYPFSKWAAKAEIMAAYSFYKNQDYEDVARVVDDFIRINPSNDGISYMLYLKAMSYYNQIPDIKRAQDATKNASMTFRELNARFPQSLYFVDAKEKLVFVDEHIAGAKMSVGRYQIDDQNYIGALKNFYEVVSRYSYTNQAPEAYYRIFEIYEKLGISSESEKIYEILAMKFPENKWFLEAKKIR